MLEKLTEILKDPSMSTIEVKMQLLPFFLFDV